MTYAEAFEGLQRSLAGQPDVIPEGWLTREQWGEKTGLSDTSLWRVLREGLRSGKVEMQKFKIQSASRLLPIPHYRIC